MSGFINTFPRKRESWLSAQVITSNLRRIVQKNRVYFHVSLRNLCLLIINSLLVWKLFFMHGNFEKSNENAKLICEYSSRNGLNHESVQ